jgi:hypothetical protein|tara:strand:+ start:259 stop:441 length:183 start_codon:yes stop_codon:yes gene_type:complete
MKEEEYIIGVWEIQFYLQHEDGQPVVDEKGEVKKFYSPHSDFSNYDFTAGLEIDELREVE